MTDISSYPTCLRRPDAGGHVQTRTTQTVTRYRKRFAGMIATLCRKNRWASADAQDLAIDLGERAAHYTRNSLKQFHGAIRQNLRDRWDGGDISLAAVEQVDALLRSHRPMPAKPKAGKARTSAGRARSVRPEQIAALAAVLLREPTPIRQIAAGLLEHGVELATRPGEFLSIRQDPLGRFWVRSAKYSEDNRRGLQKARMVPTEFYAPWEIADLQAVAVLIATERARGATTQKLLRRCQRAIRLARAEVGGRSRRVTAYTIRHQARANMAAMGMTTAEVAVIMGHASAGTAQTHYVPARRAWRGMAGSKPLAVDAALVALVRPAHPSRGWDSSPRAGYGII